MKAPTITARWSTNKEEATVSFSKEFKEAYWVLKADMLKDVILLLEDSYNKLLEEDQKIGG